MSRFFNYFPKTLYTSNNLTAGVDTVTNIIARFGFESTLKNNSSAFYKYNIQESDTPEIIASKYYDNPERHWIVLLFNDIMDPQFDWPLQYQPFIDYVNTKYSHILFRRLIAHRVSLGTSTHRLSIVLVFIRIIIRCKLSFSNEAAKHGPAAGVMPVFKPLKPLPSSLFVLLHQNSRGSSWMSRPTHVQLLLITISRTRGSCIAMQASFPISAAVDLLFLCDSPVGLAQLVDSSPRALAYLFISCKKYFMG